MNERSPRLLPAALSDYAPWPEVRPHTGRELARLLALLEGGGFRGGGVALGHGRDAASRDAAAAFAHAWQGSGGWLAEVVDWPEDAASWLRQARRLTRAEPDAWVVAAGSAGWAQMSRRLRHSTDWDPRRTFGFASAGDSRLATAAGPGVLDGMRGATADGRVWVIRRGWLVESDDE
ncbi:ABC transporter substrate-binding protein [Streptomyces sp. ME02-8801-2C]|uniref:ABC transporter substrate-binding protein n=1 Tax=Streptomyces sp. ME02-8801-2C TaxID=3028680 RepID=UPI0029A0D505|nr:ABC transporter substrate-binding protein [Streptomyces sp. ME02-8801-2C]MDX3451661.1 ABC transporter substrate-binding protein [Streptomyces sp. ME02-8801-2C]